MSDSGKRGDDRSRTAPPLLTDGELRVYIAVLELSARGWAPTHSEIGEFLGWKSRGSVNAYLRRLKDKGVLEGSGRALRVVRWEWHRDQA